jgi:hypothetical protein
VRRLGRNADGEVLESGRVPDCYLGLVHHASDDEEEEEDGVLVVAPAALLHPSVPQPDGIVLYELGPVTPTGCRTNWCLCPTSQWSCAPGLMAPGLGSGSIRRRPSARSLPPGAAATSRGLQLGG